MTDPFKVMYDAFVDDTRSFFEGCISPDGTFPDAADQKEYEKRIAIQKAEIVEHYTRIAEISP